MDTGVPLRVLVAEDDPGLAVHTASPKGEGARFTLVFPAYAPQAAPGHYDV